MGYAREGHVVGKLQGTIPSRVSIERARTETECTISSCISIDPLGAVQEYFPAGEEVAVMVQVVDVDLEPAISDLLEEALGDGVAFLRYDLEGGLDPRRIIQIHHLRAEIPASQLLDIVGHDCAAFRTIRPKPDERYSVNPLCLHRQGQQPLEDTLHCSIDRPVRKGNVLPIAQARSLKVLPDCNRLERPQPIVDVLDHWTVTEPSLASISVVLVAFMTKVLDDFVRIERESERQSVRDDVRECIIELICGALSSETRRGLPEAHRVWTKTKITAILRQLSN